MKIMGTHPYFVRSGEIAEVTGVELCTPKGLEGRMCYRVRFDDGMEEFWPMSEFYAYELIADEIT